MGDPMTRMIDNYVALIWLLGRHGAESEEFAADLRVRALRIPVNCDLACRTTAEGGGLPVRRPDSPDCLRRGERGPGCGVPACCHCGSALMAAQPASRKIGCACGRAWTG